ncbi:hypothetical protein Noda2021_01430 [Candidatus Dependentiae bacterium Noda2021]|nr:hypothetical protein Noda2021_01430 [Candidatus Dependentiae bacterium Noda2021]
MNSIKSLIILITASTLTSFAAINSNKFFPQIKRITNHTNKDLYLELTYPDSAHSKTIILKAGKTINNINLPLYKTAEDESGQWSIQNEEKEELATFDYGVTFKGPRFFRDQLNVNFLRPSDISFLDWTQSVDLATHKKITLNITLDLKGDDLGLTDMDVQGIAQ